MAFAGAFILDQNGNVSGTEDFNHNGTTANEALNATAATLGTGTGPGSIGISTPSFPLSFDYYPIDSTHFKLIETDYADFVAGDAFTQTGFTSIPTSGTSTFSMAGILDIVDAAGSLTFGASSVTGTADLNFYSSGSGTGSYTPNISFSGNEGAAGTGGRVVITLTQSIPATTITVYPSSVGLVMLETDTNAVSLGVAYPQTNGAALATSQGYAFDLSAVNFSNGISSAVEEDDIGQFNTTSSTAYNGEVYINDEGSTNAPQTWDGTISGNAVTTTAGGSGFVSFNFYPITNSQFLVLETDGNQIGTGIFFAQTSPSSAVTAATATRALPTFAVHPLVRPHLGRTRGSLRTKQK